MEYVLNYISKVSTLIRSTENALGIQERNQFQIAWYAAFCLKDKLRSGPTNNTLIGVFLVTNNEFEIRQLGARNANKSVKVHLSNSSEALRE